MTHTPPARPGSLSLRQRIERRVHGTFLDTEALADQVFVALDAQYLNIKTRADFESLPSVQVSRAQALRTLPHSRPAAKA